MTDGSDYWDKPARRRLGRRRLLIGAATGAALAGTAAAACGNRKSAQGQAGTTAGTSGSQAAETPQSGGTYSYYLVRTSS